LSSKVDTHSSILNLLKAIFLSFTVNSDAFFLLTTSKSSPKLLESVVYFLLVVELAADDNRLNPSDNEDGEYLKKFHLYYRF
jgi:hypothetical protein